MDTKILNSNFIIRIQLWDRSSLKHTFLDIYSIIAGSFNDLTKENVRSLFFYHSKLKSQINSENEN